jgi:ribosomal protein S18 acetylase RimI-like enzyme
LSGVFKINWSPWSFSHGFKGQTIVTNHDDASLAFCEIETRLSDGRPVCLRTIRPSDEDRIRHGISEMSDRSRYLRFFSAFREPPESIVQHLGAVDGRNHIAWGAILLDGKCHPPVGAAHVMRTKIQASTGELAIAVLDDYHGQGLARMLIAAVLVACSNECLPILEMYILGENQAAIGLMCSIGAERMPGTGSVSHFQLTVAQTLDRLKHTAQPQGVVDVLNALTGVPVQASRLA